ncbi:MAG: thiamine pyrophosphate-dependent enzyme [Thermoplasmatota archaeon]
MSEDLGTYHENTWCKGCGNFGLLNAFKQAVKKMEEKGIKKKDLLISSGIGCHAKIFDYVDLSGLYSIHGREITSIQGMKFANPDLKVIGFAGDGDIYGEGIEHLIFAAKRNEDVTLFVHNNEAYSLTTGQVSPTSKEGYKGPSTPKGSIERPLNPLALVLSAGASFVARGYAGNISHLTDLMVKAVEHEGFAIVDIIQPCVTFLNTYSKYNDLVEVIDEKAETMNEAIELTQEEDRVPLGIYYQEELPVYHEKLYGDTNPVKDKLSRDERLKRVNKLLEVD